MELIQGTFVVSVPKDSSNFQKAFTISKEKFKRLIQDKTLNQIIDLGPIFGKDFLSAHVARVSQITGKNIMEVVGKLMNDIKITEEDQDFLVSSAENKLQEYKIIIEDNMEIDFYLSMYLYGTWQKYVLCKLVLPSDFYNAKNLGVVLNAYSREGLMKVVRAIASKTLVVDGEQEFLVIS